MRSWLEEFAGYRINVTEGRIDRWLAQFEEGHRDVAARVLDVVDFVSNEMIAAAFRHALGALPGWNLDANQREGCWFFVAFTGSGKSGDQMLHRFRTANNLSGRQHDSLFCYRSELLSLAPKGEDTVVFVDDFAGTGNQACRAWDEVYQELLPDCPRIYLMLVASSAAARERIAAETEMTPQVHLELGEADNLFSDACTRFSDADKAAILEYCERAAPQHPRGYGDCGFVVVLAHKSPNNSIPILHARRPGHWEGVFRRHD